jgi:hypothetical protein
VFLIEGGILWLDGCLGIEPGVAYSHTVFEGLQVGTLVKPPWPGGGEEGANADRAPTL